MSGATVRALFMPYPSTSGTWGSTNYLLAIAEEAQRRGWECAFHICDPTADVVEDAGFPVFRFRGKTPPDYRGPVRGFYEVVEALGFDDFAYHRELLSSEMHVIDELRPSVLVTDFRPTAIISARSRDIPIASLAMWATDGHTHGIGNHQYDIGAEQLSSDFGGPVLGSFPSLLWNHADIRLATSFVDFEPELTSRSVTYVGVLERHTAIDQKGLSSLTIPDRLVIAYMSTSPWNNERLAESLARTVESTGAVLWCVGNANTYERKLGDRSRLFRYLPFTQVVQRAEAVIFHGGQGTALATLAAQVPSIVVPGIHYERIYTAKSVERLGAGRHISVEDLRRSRLVAHLEAIMLDDSCREGAARAAQSLNQHRGAADAVDAIAGYIV